MASYTVQLLHPTFLREVLHLVSSKQLFETVLFDPLSCAPQTLQPPAPPLHVSAPIPVPPPLHPTPAPPISAPPHDPTPTSALKIIRLYKSRLALISSILNLQTCRVKQCSIAEPKS